MTRLRAAGADAVTWVVLIAVSAFFLLPVFWIVTTSFKPSAEIQRTPATLLPMHPTIDHYAVALDGDFRDFLLNSLVSSGGATLIGLLLAVPAAYGFARYRYRGSAMLLGFIVVTRIFPPIALALPFFVQFRTLGLIDNRLGLVIAYLPIVLPLMIWILHGFFRQFPGELIEAARIDGLTTAGILTRIVLPLSLPALGVATLFGFLVAWNEFVIALTITRTPAAQTMPVGISTLITQFQTLWGPMMAVAVIYLVPLLLVTIMSQRGLVTGLMSGANKG
jgi:multiple sugar transport system permease protein